MNTASNNEEVAFYATVIYLPYSIIYWTFIMGALAIIEPYNSKWKEYFICFFRDAIFHWLLPKPITIIRELQIQYDGDYQILESGGNHFVRCTIEDKVVYGFWWMCRYGKSTKYFQIRLGYPIKPGLHVASSISKKINFIPCFIINPYCSFLTEKSS